MVEKSGFNVNDFVTVSVVGMILVIFGTFLYSNFAGKSLAPVGIGIYLLAVSLAVLAGFVLVKRLRNEVVVFNKGDFFMLLLVVAVVVFVFWQFPKFVPQLFSVASAEVFSGGLLG